MGIYDEMVNKEVLRKLERILSVTIGGNENKTHILRNKKNILHIIKKIIDIILFIPVFIYLE